MNRGVDLNCDMGESFGAWTMGSDAEMLDIVSSANVACGFHAGDPLVMAETLQQARRRGVAVGAHPGFLDLWGFGRRQIRGDSPADIERMIAYQIGALMGVAALVGSAVTHVKAHGALSNMAAVEMDLALAIARAVKGVEPGLIFVVMPGNCLERAGEAEGLRLAREVFADRTYDDDGNLTPRKQPGAVIHDAALAAGRVLEMVQDGAIRATSGKRIPVRIDTICVHGDNPAAVAMARAVRGTLEGAGIAIRPMRELVA
ncbi:MAG: 5-oxoprolinase subunit PxpA [Alphaproteobacteria bacterium]|nr:5-oxoprolinase subunit PxpA [Alphaproteobacteria bacterium]